MAKVANKTANKKVTGKSKKPKKKRPVEITAREMVEIAQRPESGGCGCVGIVFETGKPGSRRDADYW